MGIIQNKIKKGKRNKRRREPGCDDQKSQTKV